MGHDTVPNFVVMRLSPPSYQCVSWPVLDVSDALVALEKETVDTIKPAVYNPTLVLPQYVNEVFLGETLDLSVVLSNSHKAPFTSVSFKVEIVVDDLEGEPIVFEPFTDITLESRKKPHRTTISHTFKHASQHNMTFTVNFKFGKKNCQMVKRAVWNAVHPLRFDCFQEKDAYGKVHMETIVTNISKLVVTLAAMKVQTAKDPALQDCLYQKNDDINAIAVLTPNAAHSVIFKDLDMSKELSLWTSWQCYERGTGEIVTPMGSFYKLPLIAYNVLVHPGTVKCKEEFTIVIKITNTDKKPLKCRLKFNETRIRSMIVQIDDCLDLGILKHQEERQVEVPLMCLSSGIHVINGIEIHADPHIVVPVTDLEVLAL